MRISSITKNAGKACNNRLYRHIRTFEKIIKNYFVIYVTYIVNIDDGTVCYDDDTLHNWEINKGYYSIDLVNELSNSDN